MKKLLFAALIAVAATIVLLPCTAGAISIPGGVITGTTLPDAVKYMFLANAGVSDMTYSTYVGHGGKSYYKYKITLTQDVEVLNDIKITDYGNLEIDLLEHTVKANQSVNCLFDVDTGSSESDGILTIKGLKGSKVVSNTGHTVHLSGKYAVFYLNPGNNIFALDTEIENSGTDGCAVMVENRGQAYLNDATLSMTDANSDMAGLYYTGSATLVEIKNINVLSKAAYGIRRVGDEYAILKILLNKMLLNGLKGFWITGRTYSIDAQEVIVENGLALTCEWTTGYTGGTRMTIRTTGPVFGNAVYSLSLPTSVEGGSVAAAPARLLGTTVYPEGYDALKNLFPLLNINVAFTPDEGYYFESATVTGVGGISAADLGNGVYRFPMPQESASLIDVVFKEITPRPFHFRGDYSLVTASYDAAGSPVSITDGSNVPSNALVSVKMDSNGLKKPKFGTSGDCCRYEYQPAASGQVMKTVYIDSADYMFNMPDGDTYLLAVYEAASPDVRTVAFYDGDTAYEARTPQRPQFLNDGGKAEQPAAPVKGKLKFVGWTTDKAGKNVYDFDLPVTGDLNLYAKWAAIVVTKQPEAEKTIYLDVDEYLTEMLSVGAYVNPISLGLTPSFAWFECDSNGNLEGDSLGSADKLTLSEFPSLGEHYYVCRMTNADCADVYSNVSKVTVGDTPEMLKLKFETQPSPLTSAVRGAITQKLSVKLAPVEGWGGTPAFEWYECEETGAIKGAALGAESEFSLPADLAAGTYYYKCAASMPWYRDVSSNIAKVNVEAPDSVTFTAHPRNATVEVGSVTQSLTAKAVVNPEKFNLTPVYDWFRCDESGAVTGDSLGNLEAFPLPDLGKEGSDYFVCRASFPGLEPVYSNVAKATYVISPHIVILDGPQASSDIYLGIDEYLTDTVSVTAAIKPDWQAQDLTYDWFECDEAGNVSDERSYKICTENKLSLPAFPSLGEHYYLCVVTGAGLMKITDVAKVMVHDTPESMKLSFTTQPAPVTDVTMGEINLTLTAEAQAPQPEQGVPTLNWYACDSLGAIRGAPLAVGADFTVPTGLGEGNYYYKCVATMPWYAKAESDRARVAVTDPAPRPREILFSVEPDDMTVFVGEETQYLTAKACVFPVELNLTPDYEWFSYNNINGYPVGDSLGTDASFPLPDLGSGTVAYFVCRASYEGLQPQYSRAAKVTYEAPRKPIIDFEGRKDMYVFNKRFSLQLDSQGVRPIKWKVVGGALNEGAVLNERTGRIYSDSLADSAINRVYTVTIEASNEYASDTKEISYLLYDDRAVPTIQALGQNGLAQGYKNKAYSHQFVSAASEAYKPEWTVVLPNEGDALPPGMELNAETGVLSGTPTAHGEYGFTVRAANQFFTRDKDVKLTILERAPFSFANASIPVDTVAIGVGSEFSWAETNPHLNDIIPDWSDITFFSSDTSVATVSPIGKITAKSKGDAIIKIVIGGREDINFGKTKAVLLGDEFNVRVHVVDGGEAVESVSLSPASALAPGGKLALEARVSPETAKYKKLYWSSSDQNVATVDANGVVRGVSPGIAEITAMATSGVTSSVSVAVTNKVSEITLSKKELTLGLGQTSRLVATAKPRAASEAEIVWSSGNPDTASVDDGIVTGKAVGKAVITAQNPATGVKAECQVSVVEGATGEIYELLVLNGLGSGEYRAGETVAVKADAPAAGQRFARWTSETEGLTIASALSRETTVTMPGAHARVTAEYENARLTGISLSPEKRIMDIGDKYELDIIGDPADAGFPEDAVWTSDNPDAATVDESGAVTAVAPGEARITARVGEFEDDCLIAVAPETEAQKLKLTCDVLAIQKGKTLKPQILSGLSGAWSTGDEKIARINKKGLLKAVKVGETTLTFKVGAADKTAKFMGKAIALGDEITVKLYVVKKGKAVKKISVEPQKLIVAPGESASAVAAIKPKKAKYKTVFWQSADPSVASVDENGLIRGVALGKTTVTATATSGVSADIEVTVASGAEKSKLDAVKTSR